jgi:hypothetical protein
MTGADEPPVLIRGNDEEGLSCPTSVIGHLS